MPVSPDSESGDYPHRLTLRKRGWPGVALADIGRHGEPTNDPGFFICEGCGAQHAPSYVGCNAFRDPTTERCVGTLGEVFHCARPFGHLGRHEVIERGQRVTWEPLSKPAHSASSKAVP